MIKDELETPVFKLMTDLDKTFQPAKEADRDNLVILAQQIENSGGRLNITPITGRPVGYVPAILEKTNQLFSEYDLSKPCEFGYGESGMIQAIPVCAEYQKFILAHDDNIVREAKLIRNKVYEELEKKYNMVVERDFIIDNNRLCSTVIQPLPHKMGEWKNHIKEDLISSLAKNSEIGHCVNCFRNDAEAIQVDHKSLNKSKTLAYDLLSDFKKGNLIKSLALSCDGDNDVGAATWMVRFSKRVKVARSQLNSGVSEKDAVLPVLKMFNGFIPLFDKNTVKTLVNNVRNGFEHINVFLPEKVHANLVTLKNQYPDIVIQSDKRMLTGVLDCMGSTWKFPLKLGYDKVYREIDNVASPLKKRELMKKINSYRRENMETIDRNLDVANKKLIISELTNSKMFQSRKQASLSHMF